MKKNICIVYYIYLNPNRKWQDIVKGQIEDILLSGILSKTIEFHVAICGDDKIREDAKLLINSHVKVPVIYSDFFENYYEYPGIKLVYDLANRNPDWIFFYMHSKGMVFNKTIEGRSKMEINILRQTINAWKEALDVLNTNSSIQKVGLYPNIKGGIWFNFWFVKGLYIINQLEDPLRTNTNRYYYEDWLGLSKEKAIDYYSLIKKKPFEFSAKDASKLALI
jgi:hypothetical protein